MESKAVYDVRAGQMAVRSPENHHIWQMDIQSVRFIHAELLGLYQDCTRNAPSNKHEVMICDPVKLSKKGGVHNYFRKNNLSTDRLLRKSNGKKELSILLEATLLIYKRKRV
jgi:hypothetical protein